MEIRMDRVLDGKMLGALRVATLIPQQNFKP